MEFTEIISPLYLQIIVPFIALETVWYSIHECVHMNIVYEHKMYSTLFFPNLLFYVSYIGRWTQMQKQKLKLKKIIIYLPNSGYEQTKKKQIQQDTLTMN